MQVRVLGQITRVMRSVFAASEAGLRSNSKAKVDATVLSIVESGGPFLELDLSQWPPGGLPLLAMKWVSLQLGSSQLHTRIVSEPDSVQREMQADFLNLCEELLELLKAVGDSSSQGASEMRTACHEVRVGPPVAVISTRRICPLRSKTRECCVGLPIFGAY
jgi:hypothetical protein